LSLSGKTLSLKGGALGKSASPSGRGHSVAVEVRRSRKPSDRSTTEDSNTDLSLTENEREARAAALKAALEGNAKKTELPKRRVMTLEDKKAQEAEAAAEAKSREEAIKAKEEEDNRRTNALARSIGVAPEDLPPRTIDPDSVASALRGDSRKKSYFVDDTDDDIQILHLSGLYFIKMTF
jgi:hypothetical protein